MKTKRSVNAQIDDYQIQRQREREQRSAECLTIANAIGHALATRTGQAWDASTNPEHYHRNFDLTRRFDGLNIHVRQRIDNPPTWDAAPGSISDPAAPGAKIHLHDYRERDDSAFSANMTAAKTPAQLAADIARRILPVAEAAAARALEATAAKHTRDEWVKQTAAALIALMPGASLLDGTRSEYPKVVHHGTPYIVAVLDSHDRSMDLTIDDQTPDQVRAILATIEFPPETDQE